MNDGISRIDMRDSCIREFIAKAKQYIEMSMLTPELLRVFIRKIEVFEKLEKYSRTASNPINIHYAFQLPEQDGSPCLRCYFQAICEKLPKKASTRKAKCLPCTYRPEFSVKNTTAISEGLFLFCKKKIKKFLFFRNIF